MSRRRPAAPGRPGATVVLDQFDRAQLCDALSRIVGLAASVEEHLTVAAYRSGTLPSAWTEARVDAIREAASELVEAVRRSPLAAD